MNIDYKIIRSAKRKTIALQIKKNEVIVRAPENVSHQYIQSLVDNKTSWILNKLALQRQTLATPLPSYLPKSTVLVFGEERTLQVEYQKSKPSTTVNITGDQINLILPLYVQKKSEDLKYLSAQIKKHLAVWMKTKAEMYLSYRLTELSKQLSLTPRSYQIKRYKARWGSCNNKHELSFNYLLVMTPSWVFDYVIIHELCHIKHLNHSAKFWALVEKHMPNYKSANQWLKQHQAQMHW